jgi:hypothetical protein
VRGGDHVGTLDHADGRGLRNVVAGGCLRRQLVGLVGVWDFAFDASSNVVDVYIGYLRDKLDRPFGVHSIETVRGVGYRIGDADCAPIPDDHGPGLPFCC